MKKTLPKIIALLLCISLLLCGCEKKPSAPVNIEALLATVLAEVDFATELEDAGADAWLYLPALPQGAQVRLYIGSGYFADEVLLITLAQEADVKAALAAVEAHLEHKTQQFRNYIPEEVDKISKAITWQDDTHILLCISNDRVTAQHVLDNAADPSYTVPPATQAPTTAPTTAPSTAPATEPTTLPPTTVPPTTAPPATEPALQSQSGTIHSYGTGVIRVDDMAYETYGYVADASEKYAAVISQAAELLAPEGVTVYDLLIPTAIGIVFPDDMAAAYSNYTDQGEAISRMFSMMSDQVVKVDCYPTLRLHRDEYLYFRTDHHWNGPGAYYAYESFCQAKGIQPYTMEQRPLWEFDGFLGTHYFLNTDKDPALAQTRDTILAYDTHCDVSMYYYDTSGAKINWEVIYDVSDWQAGMKYNCFAAADQPMAVFTNHDLNDGSACIVVKESYGNALMSYIADHYQTVYEIDYRYWTGSLVEFARENGVTDVIFANNLAMTGNSAQIAMIKRIF